MLLWLVPLLAVLGFAGWLVYRAVRFRPPAGFRQAGPRPVTVPEMPIAVKLGELLQIATVAYRDPALEDAAAFANFQDRLQALYPHVAAQCARVLVGDKGIIYRWAGHSDEAPAVLMSHYDVVPAQAEGWTKPPFSGEIAEGYVWGRGALDTKCTLAAAMEAADGLIAQGFVPVNDIYLCFSGDEEIMGPTAEAMLSALQEWGVQPAFVLDEGGGVVPDALPGLTVPCALIGTGEKGLAELTVTATANPGHAAMPPRHTAVGRLAWAVRRLERWPWPLRYTPPVRQLMEDAGRHARLPWRPVYANLGPLRPLISLWAGLRGGEINALLRTTCAFTSLAGSPAVNVLPDRASATASVRILPGENSKSVRRRAERLLKRKDLEIAIRAISEPSPPSLTGDGAWQVLTEAVAQVWPEALIAPYLFPACTDSRHYARVSQHVYRFSALAWTRQERALMHGHDERISLKALARMQAFYEILISKL